MENTFYIETIKMVSDDKNTIANLFETEVFRLLNSGAVDKNHHHRGALYTVALENVMSMFDNETRRETEDYKNLKKF